MLRPSMRNRSLLPTICFLLIALLAAAGLLYFLLEPTGLEEAVEEATEQEIPEEPAAVATPAVSEPQPEPEPPPIQWTAQALWEASSQEDPELIVLAEDLVTESPARIRFCTYNIENFADGIDDGDVRTPIMTRRQAMGAARILEGIAPDILVLQEIENADSVKWLNRYFSPSYPVGYVTRFSRFGRSIKLNLAVLSRYPLAHVKEIDFGKLQRRKGLTSAPPRGLLRFSVELGASRYLLVYVVHLKSNWGDREANFEKRAKAMEIAAEDMERFMADRNPKEWEVLVAGDMNTDPDVERFENDHSLEPFMSFGDLWKGRPIEERTTLPTKYGDPNLEFPPIGFDRILVSPTLRERPWVVGEPVAVAKGVDTADVFAKPGTTLDIVSDHYPVYVDLTE